MPGEHGFDVVSVYTLPTLYSPSSLIFCSPTPPSSLYSILIPCFLPLSLILLQPNASIVTYMWDEALGLLTSGLLVIPEGVRVLFTDAGEATCSDGGA